MPGRRSCQRGARSLLQHWARPRRPDTASHRPALFTPSFRALIAAQSGFGFAFSSFFLLPKFLVGSLGASPTELGLVMATHGMTIVACLPIAGRLVDRHGRRRFLTGGALLMGVATLGFVAVTRVGPLIYGLRILQAVAFSFAFAAGGALAVDESPPERLAQGVAVFGLSFLSMNAIAPATAELVAGRAGWPAAFAVASLGAFLCALLSLRIRERPALGAPAPRPAVGILARAPRVYVVIALVGLALSAMFTFHQPYALSLGIHRVSDFFVAYALTAVVLRAGFGHVFDSFGHRRAVLTALVPYALILLAAIRLDVVGLAFLGVGMGLAHGTVYPVWNTVALSGAAPTERGRVMAWFQAAFNAGVGVGALALGVLADAAGYPAVFVAGAVAILGALGLVATAPRGSRADGVRV
jgi:MFS family permease